MIAFGCIRSWMYSGGASMYRSDWSCASFPRHTSCGSRSLFRRSYAIWMDFLMFGCTMGCCSADGRFLRFWFLCEMLLMERWVVMVVVCGIAAFHLDCD